ncbi:MAG: AraC family transcriptional regulator [Parasphingorhabdus sp.]
MSAYLLWSAPWFEILPSEVQAVSFALTLYNPLLFWLATRALFNDAMSFSRLEAVVTALYSIVTFALIISRYQDADDAANALAVGYRITAFVLVLQSLSQMIRQYGDDLLNPRRRMRIFLFGILGTYLVGLFVIRLIFPDAKPPESIMTLNALTVAILAIANNFVCVNFRTELLPPPKTSESLVLQNEKFDYSDIATPETQLIAKVTGAMENDHMYREEALTVSALARAMGAQEYLLRRAINQGLGYRNFSQFLNSYRLSEIRTALCDPGKGHLPILTIAYDAGFNSIGPFNRAFKQAYGVTPSQFRRSHRPKDSKEKVTVPKT